MKKGLRMSFIKNKPPKSYAITSTPSLRTMRSGPRLFDLLKVQRAKKLAEGAEMVLMLCHRSSLPHTEEASIRCPFKGREIRENGPGQILSEWLPQLICGCWVMVKFLPRLPTHLNTNHSNIWILEGQVCFYGFQVSVTQTVCVQGPKTDSLNFMIWAEVFALASLLLLCDDWYDCWPSPTSLKYVLNILHAIF